MAKKKAKAKTDREIMTEAILKSARRRAESASPKELLSQMAEESRFEFGASRPGGENLPEADPYRHRTEASPGGWGPSTDKPPSGFRVHPNAKAFVKKLSWPWGQGEETEDRPPAVENWVENTPRHGVYRGTRDFESGHQYGAPFHEEAMKYGGPDYPQSELVGPPDPIPPDYRSGYQYGSKRGKPLSEEVLGIMMEAAGKEARHGPWRESYGYEYPRSKEDFTDAEVKAYLRDIETDYLEGEGWNDRAPGWLAKPGSWAEAQYKDWKEGKKLNYATSTFGWHNGKSDESMMTGGVPGMTREQFITEMETPRKPKSKKKQ